MIVPLLLVYVHYKLEMLLMASNAVLRDVIILEAIISLFQRRGLYKPL